MYGNMKAGSVTIINRHQAINVKKALCILYNSILNSKDAVSEKVKDIIKI